MKKVLMTILSVAVCVFFSACETSSVNNAEVKPVDKNLDCEAILLDRAEALKTLVTSYLNENPEELAFGLSEVRFFTGEVEHYEVISDNIKSVKNVSDIFSDKIYKEYLETILSGYSNPRLYEDENGKLIFAKKYGGTKTVETWYLGCEVENEKIIGHFVSLDGLFGDEKACSNAEALNNEYFYIFYDITVQNINDEYLLTDCSYTEKNGKDDLSFYCHGMCYNKGIIDRELITNEKLKPKFLQ